MERNQNWRANLRQGLGIDKAGLNYLARIFGVAFFCVVIHIVWANFFPLWSYIVNTAGMHGIVKVAIDTLVLALLAASALSMILLFSAITAKFIVYALIIVGAVYSYYHHHFGIEISDEIMVAMLFFPEKNDVSSSIDHYLGIYVALLAVPAFIACHWAINTIPEYRSSSSKFFTRIAHFGVKKLTHVAILFALVPTVLAIGHLTSDISLLSYRVRTISEQLMPSFFLSRKSNIRKLARMYRGDLELSDYSSSGLSFNTKSESPLVVVLIVGESLRSDRLSINGYHRSTTPLMEKRSNLYSFKDVLACSTTTSVSLPCMLTNNELDGWVGRFSSGNYTPKYSVSKVFTDLNFDTHFISNANRDYGLYISKDFHGTSEVTLSNSLRKKYIIQENDFGDMLLAKEINAQVNKDTYYVLGTMGSHRDYFARYPEKFAVYKPDMGGNLEAINNAYDNTVIYFDKVFDSIATKLNDQNAIIVYVSDHGESLGENGVFLHGAPIATAPDEQKHVPMIVWMSDKYIQEHPQQHNNIQQWHADHVRGEALLTHDYLFHSLLDCAGIQSSTGDIEPRLSVCSHRNTVERATQIGINSP